MPVITTGLTITASMGSWYFEDLPIRADNASVTRFCIEKGYGAPGSYTQDESRWSNDGGRLMNYYGPFSGSTYWLNVFGYEAIVTSITT